MNFAKLLVFSGKAKQNPVIQMVRAIRKHPVFRGAKFDFYTPSLNPEKLIVVFGQAHPVLTGKISNKQLRQITGCQSRLVSYYAFFHSQFGMTKFGGEGLHGDANALYLSAGAATPLFDEAVQHLHLDVQKAGMSWNSMLALAQKVISHIGGLWRDALRMSNKRDIERYAQAVDGQAFYDYLSPAQIAMYPVEGETQYQHVLQNVRKLEQEIVALENNYDFRVAKSKLGRTNKRKDFSDKELDLLKKHQLLVKEFNRVLGSDFRERATMDIMRERADKEPLVVFTMGVAHRKNYKKLLHAYFSNTRTAFLFIRAPELVPKYWMQIVGLLVVLVGLGAIWMLL